ncbi:MAG: hypothetical protein ABW039_03500 [Sphingobium sp.]
MARPLKVFRTAIGFHDAYVAAPSMKAALKAWGADANLFARGQAEAVTDPKLMEEALASPGTVIKRTRGSMAEHLAALPQPSPRREAKGDKAATPRSAAKPPPRPSRTALDMAEDALAEAERVQDSERRALADKEARLKREKAAMDKRHMDDVARLAKKRDEARARYNRAMEAWRS